MIEIEKVIPLQFRHAVELYERLQHKAVDKNPTEIFDEYGYQLSADSGLVKVFIGFIGETATGIGLSEASFRKAMTVLSTMNAVTKIKHSGRYNSPGAWILNYQPTLEQYSDYRGYNKSVLGRTLPSKADAIIRDQQLIFNELTELRKRVKDLEELVGHNLGRGQEMPEVQKPRG